MRELYSNQDLMTIQAQIKKRWVLLGIPAVLLLALGIVSAILRVQWLTTVAFLALSVLLIFCIEMFIRPLNQYQKLILAAIKGRTHTETLIYDHLEPEESLVDGVAYRSLVFLGQPDKHGTREQRFYWDILRPLPDFSEGDSLLLKYTDRMIIGYQPLQAV